MIEARAVVIAKPGAAAEVRRLRVPDVEPGEALLEVELSEVCGTDVHLRAGRLTGVPYPLIPGHVTVGRLAGSRGTLRDVHGRALREGERITFLDVHRTCNACWSCLVAKASTRCPSRKVYGITYGAADGLAGGWAEKLVLKAGTRCLPLDDIDPRSFMAGGCSLPTALHAIERAAIGIGDTVLVLGSGPVGLSAIILARMSGADVLCIGAPAARLAAARSVGAGASLDITDASVDERLEWVREHTGGRGADITIEAAGPPEAAVQAMRFTRDAGRVVIVGQYTDHGDAAFNPHLDLNRKHLDVRGCWGSDFSHFYRAVRLMRDPGRAAPWTRLRVETFTLERANEALDQVAAGNIIKALIQP
ncbi:MAG: zinc-binding dehydrogenase [Gemmatimonadetes bacterium]|nr:zinc-binding dehydrogenase [Gemmatimonadota bacterium]